MSKPIVSVIIPYRNQPSRSLALERVLSAYEMQSYENIEIIIVEDGTCSIQELREAVNSRSVRYYRTPYKHQYFRPGLCRNIGAARAYGEIFVFNDADIIPEFEAVAWIVKTHLENHIIIVGNVWRIEGGLQAIEDMDSNKADQLKMFSRPWIEHYEQLGPLEWSTTGMVRNSDSWLHFLSGFCSFRRGDFLNLLGFDHHYFGWGYEDTDIGCRILRRGMSMAFFDNIMGFHINHQLDPDIAITGLRNHAYFTQKFPELKSSPVIVKEYETFKKMIGNSYVIPDDPLQPRYYSSRGKFRHILEHPILHLHRFYRKRDSKEGSITIVIPVKNSAQFLREAVLSGAYQTRPPREVYIVINPADDNTETIAKELNARFWEVEYIVNRKKSTTAELKNQGAVAAASDYIAFLNSYDVLKSQYCEKMGAILDKNIDIGIVQCDYEEFGERNRIVRIPEFNSRSLMLDYTVGPGAVMVRRRAMEEVGGFDREKSFDDLELWIRVVTRGWGAKVVNEPLYRHRVYQESQKMSDS